jgi:hypothetical protein
MARLLALWVLILALGVGGVPVGLADPPATPVSPDGDKAAMTDIHDIRPPVPPGPDPYRLLRWAGIVIGVGVLALAAFLWYRRGRRLRAHHALAPPPDTVALEGLDALYDVSRFDGRDFYFRLSAVFRGYLEGRYGFPATGMTTEELLPRLRSLDLPDGLRRGAKDFLQTADPVKFAGVPVAETRMGEDWAFVRRFVTETRPTDAESSNPAGSGEGS